jgi:ubiquinone/menaquinone biosynthesis C-methylase UbiE
MLAFLERHLGRPIQETRVLEIGTGGGGIACVLAGQAKELVAGDCDAGTLERVAQRPDYQASPFPLVSLDAIALPFEDNSFDLVLLNGVLEFMGCREGLLSPLEYQRMALREVERVLSPGGTLYLGIENRLYPNCVFGDPHTHQPLVAWLPRKLADWYSQRRDGRPYKNWIHSYWTLRKLLREAGFQTFKSFVPLVSYQFPRCYMPVNASFAEARRAVQGKDDFPMSAEFDRVTRISWRGQLWVSFTALFRLQGVLGNAFVILATTKS